MKKLLLLAVLAILSVPAQAAETQMPKTLIGRWCWEPSTAPHSNPNINVGRYHRCDMLGGGEDFELKSHGMTDEGTIGGDDWHLTRVAREPNVYLLDFASGEHRSHAQVSVDPILNRQITVDWGNENFGKADDYGSERYAAVNDCMVKAVTAKAAKDATGKSLEPCMRNGGFVFCPGCQVFGNDGPRCESDEFGYFHSWCWQQDWARAFK